MRLHDIATAQEWEATEVRLRRRTLFGLRLTCLNRQSRDEDGSAKLAHQARVLEASSTAVQAVHPGSTATVLVTLSAGVAAAPTHAASYNWVAANRRSSPLQEGGIRDFGLWPVLEPVVSLNLSPDCYPSFLEACSGRRSWLIGNLRVRSA